MDCSVPGFPVLHCLSEFAQILVHWLGDSIYLILCLPFLPLPSIFPSIRIFSNDLAYHIRWYKCWSFSFSVSPSCDIQGWFPWFRASLVTQKYYIKQWAFLVSSSTEELGWGHGVNVMIAKGLSHSVAVKLYKYKDDSGIIERWWFNLLRSLQGIVLEEVVIEFTV